MFCPLFPSRVKQANHAGDSVEIVGLPRKKKKTGGFSGTGKGQIPLPKKGGGRRHKTVNTIRCMFDSPWINRTIWNWHFFHRLLIPQRAWYNNTLNKWWFWSQTWERWDCLWCTNTPEGCQHLPRLFFIWPVISQRACSNARPLTASRNSEMFLSPIGLLMTGWREWWAIVGGAKLPQAWQQKHMKGCNSKLLFAFCVPPPPSALPNVALEEW